MNNDNNYHQFSARGGGVLAVHTRSPREADNFMFADIFSRVIIGVVGTLLVQHKKHLVT